MNSVFFLVIEASVRSAALALCVGAILFLARIRSGSVRHAAWAAVLGAMLLMPVLPRFTPALGLPVQMPPVAYGAAPSVPDPPAVPPVRSGLIPLQRPVSLPVEANPAPAPAPSRPVWPIALLCVYCAGLAFLLARMAAGWRAARRIVRSADPVPVTVPGALVCQSALVAAPLTVGVISPRIVLPRAWAVWPEAKLRAVLSHEAAHVRRRDTVVSIAAHLNRCVFWFHPLAWWLERQLAITAEHACDEVAVRVTGQGREYAQVLLDLAEAVRLTGGRLSLQGVGMDGAGPLEQRIDRVLRGDLARGVSRTRKAAVAAACAAAIFLVAACQPTREALVARAEARAKHEKERSARSGAYWKSQRGLADAGRALTPEQAAALEAAVSRNPEDLESRKKLLFYYMFLPFRPGNGALQAAPQPIAAAARRHGFWMIERHPEDPQSSSFSAFFTPSPMDRNPDPADYARAKRLWLERADRDGQPAAVYNNAASFFSFADPPLAEKMLLRAQAVDPKGKSLNGMYGDSWSARMGSFYAQTIMRSAVSPWSEWNKSVTSSGDPTAYLAEVRRKLEQSKDTTLLLIAGGSLVMNRPDPANQPVSDAFAVGKAAIERALQLDPKSTWARQVMNKVYDQELIVSLPEAVWNGPLESRHQAIQALPDGDRFRELSILAISAGDEGVRADVLRHDAAVAKMSWEQAGRYAREALDMVPKARNHPDYGTAWFNANMVLGMAAITGGDRKAAAGYLLKAADAPATDALRYPMTGVRPWPMNWQFPNTLMAALLKAGERDAVADFLDRYARICVTNRDRSLEDAALIRSGRTPAWAAL